MLAHRAELWDWGAHKSSTHLLRAPLSQISVRRDNITFFFSDFFVFDSLFWPLIIVFHLTSCRNSPTHWTQTFILILVTRDLPPQKMNLSKNEKNVLSTMNIKLWNEWVSCLGDQPRKSFWTKLHDILLSILANKVHNLNTKILTLRWIVVQSNLYWAVLY